MAQEKRTSPIIWEQQPHPDAQAIAMDDNGVINQASLLKNLNKAFHFPDYFGNNWDALLDSLRDIVNTLSTDTIWYFGMNEHADINEADLNIWIEVMEDIHFYAKTRNLQLQIVIQKYTA